MKRNTYFAAAVIALAVAACGGKGDKKLSDASEYSSYERLDGDRSVYGLMCEGGSDSVLYLLPPDGSNPVKYNIIKAHRTNRILGSPEIGDRIAIVPNAYRKNVADMVIDIESLKGTWCYIAMPKLRDRNRMPKAMQDDFYGADADSMRSLYVVPRQQGFTLRRRNKANAVGWVHLSPEEQNGSPVTYPPVPFYTKWYMLNGKIVLAHSNHFPLTTEENKDKNKTKAPEKLINDTAEIVMLEKDTLVLKFGDRTQGYFRAKETDSGSRTNKKK